MCKCLIWPFYVCFHAWKMYCKRLRKMFLVIRKLILSPYSIQYFSITADLLNWRSANIQIGHLRTEHNSYNDLKSFWFSLKMKSFFQTRPFWVYLLTLQQQSFLSQLEINHVIHGPTGNTYVEHLKYRPCAIITSSLYTFYPIFDGQKRLFKKLFM